MGYTNVTAVAGMYPTFTRPAPKGPPDTLIQQIINDIAGVIDAALMQRYGEAQAAYSSFSLWKQSLGLPTATWSAGLAVSAGTIVVDTGDLIGVQQAQGAGTTGDTAPTWNATIGGTTTDGGVTWKNIGQSLQFAVLERGNRYGSAYQLGAILATYSIKGAADIADHYNDADWNPFLQDLTGRDKNGKPLPSAILDRLFDSSASIITPRPILQGIAGGDQPFGSTPYEEGISNVFGKYGIDFGRYGGSWGEWGQQ